MNTEINKALEVVRKGGVILYPTDTVWGLGCDAKQPEAIKKIYNIKKRADHKSLIILLPEAKDIFTYSASPPPDIIDMLNGMSRPTTVIYPQAVNLPNELIAEDGSIAIRIIRDPFCKSLLKRLRRPLVSTSANYSGCPTPQRFKDIDPLIKNQVDYIVQYRQDEETLSAPSQIIRIQQDGSLEIIRA
jgi:L-threonylcarbamoyladenylate synthase